MVEISTADYMVGMWFLDTTKVQNLLMTAMKDPKTKDWKIELRLRFYRDDKIFDSDDRKKFYSTLIPKEKTEKEFIEICKKMVNEYIAIFKPDVVDHIDVRGDGEKFMKEMSKRPWCNARKIDMDTEEGRKEALLILGEKEYNRMKKEMEHRDKEKENTNAEETGPKEGKTPRKPK